MLAFDTNVGFLAGLKSRYTYGHMSNHSYSDSPSLNHSSVDIFSLIVYYYF